MVSPGRIIRDMHVLLHRFPLLSFLEGPKAALVASKDFDDGHYKVPAERGIRAFARAYSAWAYGQAVSVYHKRLRLLS